MSTLWNRYDIGTKILDILQKAEAYDKHHHLGQPHPFLTPYQIAILFKEKYPQDFLAIGKSIGGKGNGEHTSFAQYIAKELSVYVKNETMQIEGAFLYRKLVNELSYKDGAEIIESSLGTTYDLSIFRARNANPTRQGLGNPSVTAQHSRNEPGSGTPSPSDPQQ